MAQLKETTISGNLTVNGNTFFENAEQTRQEVNFIGYDPEIDNTPTAWANAGTGVAFINSGDAVGLSGYKGFIENKYNGSGTVHQTFHSVSPLGVFSRRGYTSSGTLESWSRVLDTNFAGKTLWSGSWNSGTVSVPDTDKYTLFRIELEGKGTVILAMKHTGFIRGMGGYATSDGLTTYQFTATHSGNTWTYGSATTLYHKVDKTHNFSNTAAEAVSAIIGLL